MQSAHHLHLFVTTDPQNAWDLLHEERSLMTRLTTSCADLDDILGGGISCKQVTEIGLSSFPLF
jgi:RAD51-like protein 2